MKYIAKLGLVTLLTFIYVLIFVMIPVSFEGKYTAWEISGAMHLVVLILGWWFWSIIYLIPDSLYQRLIRITTNG